MSYRQLCPLLLAAASVAGCVPVALTAAGVGGQALATHHMSGTAYRTFAVSLPKVCDAAAVALNRMAIRLQRVERSDNNELMVARAGERSIEIELEPLTVRTTRIRVVVRKDGGMLLDGATASEIVCQTEKVLGEG